MIFLFVLTLETHTYSVLVNAVSKTYTKRAS